MGTDIHMIVERRGASGWTIADEAPGFCSSSYNAFAILADVRNGVGFAGIDTGDRFEPVAEPRGLPGDWDGMRRGAVEDGGEVDGLSLGEHSFSWLLLTELLDYNWNRRTNLRGVVGPAEFACFLETGAPTSWRGGVSGKSAVHVSNEEMVAIVKGGKAPSEHTYTAIQWSVSYKEAAPSLHSKFIPELCNWAQANGLAPEEVRIVFGFDS